VPLNLLLALSSALLLILTFPRFDLYFLAPFALTPLLLALARTRAWPKRLVLGWVVGIAYWAGACYWIHFVLAVHGGMAEWAAWLGYAAFALWQSLPTAVFALCAWPLLARPWATVSVPALWVLAEWSHTHLGFAWLDLGNAAIGMSVLARLAPWTGVYGLSFAFAMMGTVVGLVVLRRPRLQLAPLLAVPLILLLPRPPAPQRGTEVAGLVQPNLSETADWTPEWIRETRAHIEVLTLSTVPARLIVWPEAPMPLYYYEDTATREWVDGMARRTGAFLLVNATPHTSSGAPLNSALLISPDGRAVGRYDKMNLVPFGEYVPWPFQSLVSKVSSEVGDFAPGERQVTLNAGGHPIGAFVCYESVFPDFVRRFTLSGAQLLVNISNDGWYGRTAARDQHLLIVRMRAAENRRWLLRAANNGITAAIDPAGRLTRRLPSYVEAAVRTGYSYLTATTFYARHGDWFVWLSALLALAGALPPYPWRITRTSPSRTM
jgi:apolipoprotein N-acyltransferase